MLLENSKIFKFVFTMIPSKWSDNFALKLASQSRKKDKYKTLPHDEIIAAAFKRARRESEDIHLFGHFHYPYQAVFEGGASREVKVICVPSWDLPNALMLKDGRFTRLNLRASEIREADVNFKKFDPRLI